MKEGGASVDVRDADGRTPLLWAASAGSAAAVLALHQAGSKVDDADRCECSYTFGDFYHWLYYQGQERDRLTYQWTFFTVGPKKKELKDGSSSLNIFL